MHYRDEKYGKHTTDWPLHHAPLIQKISSKYARNFLRCLHTARHTDTQKHILLWKHDLLGGGKNTFCCYVIWPENWWSQPQKTL